MLAGGHSCSAGWPLARSPVPDDKRRSTGWEHHPTPTLSPPPQAALLGLGASSPAFPARPLGRHPELSRRHPMPSASFLVGLMAEDRVREVGPSHSLSLGELAHSGRAGWLGWAVLQDILGPLGELEPQFPHLCEWRRSPPKALTAFHCLTVGCVL